MKTAPALLDRRSFITTGLASLALAGSSSASEPSLATRPARVPGFFKRRLGDYELFVLSEGAIRLPAWPSFGGAPTNEAEVLAALRRWHEPQPEALLQVNMLLLRGHDRCILVDTGYGEHQSYRKGAGLLQSHLFDAGIRPSDIDTVLITHAHPDHLWGALDDGQRQYTRARHLITQEEKTAWLMTEEEIARRPQARQAMLRENRNRLESLLAFADLVSPNEALAPGLHLFPLPGHTPGQVGLDLRSGDEHFLHIVDAIPHMRLFLDHPDWHYALDSDPTQAVTTRLALLNQLANTNTLISGCHFGFPALGYIHSQYGAFSFEPEFWHWE